MSETQGGSKDTTIEVESKKTSVWDRWQGKIGLIIITSVLSATSALSLNWWNNRLRTIDYYVNTSDSLIQKPDLGGKQFAVSVDSRPVENLSSVSLWLINSSGLDHENVELEVTFEAKDGLPIDVVKDEIKPDRVATSLIASTQPRAGKLIRRYRLDVVNRPATPRGAILEGQFVFAGSFAPDVTVQVYKKGLVAQKQDFNNPVKSEIGWWAAIVTLLAFFLSGVTLGATFMLGRQTKSILAKLTAERDRLQAGLAELERKR